MIASHLGHFIPRERANDTYWIGGWVGPRAGLCRLVTYECVGILVFGNNTNQNCMHEEVQIKWNSQNIYNYLSSETFVFISAKAKFKINLYKSVILPAVLCAFEVAFARWGTNTDAEEDIRTEEGRGNTKWKKMHNEELPNFYSSYINRTIQSGGWDGQSM
jgi:hypothetical protein